MLTSSDKNAIQLFHEEEHIGRVNKEIAAVLSPLMDLSLPRSIFYDRFQLENCVYGTHFNMYCSLCYCDTNHTDDGYKIQIIIETIYATEWIDALVSILEENLINFRRI